MALRSQPRHSSGRPPARRRDADEHRRRTTTLGDSLIEVGHDGDGAAEAQHILHGLADGVRPIEHRDLHPLSRRRIVAVLESRAKRRARPCRMCWAFGGTIPVVADFDQGVAKVVVRRRCSSASRRRAGAPRRVARLAAQRHERRLEIWSGLHTFIG